MKNLQALVKSFRLLIIISIGLTSQSSPFSSLEEKFDKVSFENEQKTAQLRNSINALANKIQNTQKGKKAKKTNLQTDDIEEEKEEAGEYEDTEQLVPQDLKKVPRITTRSQKKQGKSK